MAQATKHLPHAEGFAYYHDIEGMRRIHNLHQAGLAHDHSQLHTLLDIVNNPSDHIHFYTAVHALARIGDVQAIPAFEVAMSSLDDPEARGYAQVARARLLADASAKKHTALQEAARARLSAFMAALGLDADTLNAAAAQDKHRRMMQGGDTYARETYALRELADMIYHAHDAALADAAKAAGINFSVDAGAKYKVQLAADEGKLASRAAAAKLMEMDKHREKYVIVYPGTRATPGFTAMFRLIGVVGDSDQEPVLARFLNDKEGWLAYYAKQTYPQVKMGIPWKARIGY